MYVRVQIRTEISLMFLQINYLRHCSVSPSQHRIQCISRSVMQYSWARLPKKCVGMIWEWADSYTKKKSHNYEFVATAVSCLTPHEILCINCFGHTNHCIIWSAHLYLWASLPIFKHDNFVAFSDNDGSGVVSSSICPRYGRNVDSFMWKWRHHQLIRRDDIKWPIQG